MKWLLFALLLTTACVHAPARLELPTNASWEKTGAASFKGKQDDAFFITARTGWYANGTGDLFRTDDGGATFTRVLQKPGTYWRAMGWLDDQRGFLGNIGTDYFPGVTDPTPLYRTRDGGRTVEAVAVPAEVRGICAIDVLTLPSGQTLVHAAGRVGSPAWVLRSTDAGDHWTSVDLSAQLAGITDVKFLDENVGYVAGATNGELEASHAVIVKTLDGGHTWARVYDSNRTFELIWKLSAPTANTVFATVMNYDETRPQQLVAHSGDGGAHWEELPLTDERGARQFGIGFINDQVGWVGTAKGGFQTLDGGHSWAKVSFGNVVNKLRITRDAHGFIVTAIGSDLYRLAATPHAPALPAAPPPASVETPARP